MIDSIQILMLDEKVLKHADIYSHGEFALYCGLRHLGVNVILHPWSSRYHELQVNEPTSIWDYQFWHMRGGRNGISQQRYLYDELRNMDFDMILTTQRFGRSFPEWLDECVAWFGKPLVMMGVDDGGWTEEWGIKDECIAIKWHAEVPLDSDEDVFSLPQPIFYPAHTLTARKKEYGISCFLAYNHPTRRREKLVKILEQLEGEHHLGIGYPGEDGGDHTYQSPQQYYSMLRASRVKYGIRGNGYNSQHFWEGMAAEDVMLIADIEHKIPPPIPEPGVHYIQLDEDDENIIEQAEYWLAHDDEREEIAARSREFVYHYHTPRHRAKYFIEVCAKFIPSIAEKWDATK